MQMLTEYFELEKQIHEFFGYQEDWVVLPLNDSRQYYWYVPNEKGGEIQFADTEGELLHQTGQYYESIIFTYKALPKWVYRGEGYTMICVDTRTDGNKFLEVFDNSKERPDIEAQRAKL